jgi:hypothetical protein
MLYDAKCDIIHIKSSNETEIWTNATGTMAFMQHAMKGLKQWTERYQIKKKKKVGSIRGNADSCF